MLLFKGIPERVVAEVAPDTHAAHNSIVTGVTAGVSVSGHSQNQGLFSLALLLVSVCRDTAKAKACCQRVKQQRCESSASLLNAE